jgi:pimeloyl-ACP methyl ester carboxylesterase
VSLVSIGQADLEVDVRGSGEPVLLVQTALTADELRPVASQPSLQGSYQVVLYYRRGYGRSSPAEGSGSIVRDAGDSANLLDVLDIERAHIVGVSYSAAIALQLAVTDPMRVHTLTVIEPPPVHIPNAGEFIAANRELLETYRSDGPSVALDGFLTLLMGPDWRADLDARLPGAVQQMERDAGTFFASDIPALLAWDFDEAASRHIHQPTLYIGGSGSGPWFAAVRSLMEEWLNPEEVVVVEGADHNLAVTHPRRVADAIANFISRHPITC